MLRQQKVKSLILIVLYQTIQWGGQSFYPLLVDAKVLLGLASTGEFAKLGEFCYTIPEGSVGSLHSESLVDSPDQNLVVLKESFESHRLADVSCQTLIDEARVVERFVAYQNFSAYDLKLTVDPNVDHKDIIVMVTHCGAQVSIVYRLEFANPGGLLVKHFSCHDQGLLQFYALILPLAILGIIFTTRRWLKVSRHLNNGPGTSAVVGAFLSASFFWASLFLSFAHLLLYATDGMGVPLFRVAAIFCDTVFNLGYAAVLVTLSLGDALISVRSRAAPAEPQFSPLVIGHVTNRKASDSLASDQQQSAYTETERKTYSPRKTDPPVEPSGVASQTIEMLPGIPQNDLSLYGELQKCRRDARNLMIAFFITILSTNMAAMTEKSSLYLYRHLRRRLSIPYLAVRVFLGIYVYHATDQTAMRGASTPVLREFLSSVSLIHVLWCWAVPFAVCIPLSGNHVTEYLTVIINVLSVTQILIQFKQSRLDEMFPKDLSIVSSRRGPAKRGKKAALLNHRMFFKNDTFTEHPLRSIVRR